MIATSIGVAGLCLAMVGLLALLFLVALGGRIIMTESVPDER